MAKTKGLIAGVAVSATLALIFGIGSPFAVKYRTGISNVLCGTAEAVQTEDAKQDLATSDKLCQNIEADSIVMLKNNGALPLSVTEGSSTPVNVFGYAATDKGFLLKGVGSGSSAISDDKKVTFLQGLENAGFEINEDILDEYSSLSGTRSASPSSGDVYKLAEPAISTWTDSGLLEAAKAYSDTAIFVLARDGGENVGEIPTTQSGNANKTYLDISDAEQETLDMLTENFDKVIVVLNTTNTMHTGFLEAEGVDAAISVGLTGQSGANAIGQVLSGVVNPSGKTTDIMTYGHDYDPTFVNNKVSSSSICYAEDIYYGYKWYETADAEGYFNDVTTDYGTGYDGVVEFPFGHGLSYTDFSWSIKSVNMPSESVITKDSTITVEVDVTNTGSVAGKDVVELYYTAPYTEGEVEKSAVNLLDFGKTITLEPGHTQTLTLSFTPYEMASYDCYDANNNGSATYELDEGRYSITLRKNSHELKDMDNATIYYNVQDDIIYNTDPTTGKDLSNKFTGEDAYLGLPLDGTTCGVISQYMTRENFEGTFPKTKASAPDAAKVSTAANTLYDEPYEDATMPTFGVDSGIRIAVLSNGNNATLSQLEKGENVEINDDVMDDLSEYDSDTWDDLLNQMSAAEIKKLVEEGGFHTQAVASIGKIKLYDNDGPAGFNNAAQTGQWNGDDTTVWTAYPSEASMGCSWNENLMLQLGMSMGNEGNNTAINGWYAPGVNLHRSAYTARNYEYYSEDGTLSGKMAANVIQGAKINGLNCYLKHFACSEEGPNPNGVNTWLTEQNLRENYLKPFEIAVKEGGANAMMSAFNRVGASWCGANYALLTGVLRNEWGFKGVVISDWTQGAGLGGMNCRQGVRAGNDLMLDPYSGISGALDTSNAIDMYCARQSAKNIIYAWVDTYVYNRDFDDSQLEGLTKVTTSITTRQEVNEWWIPIYWVAGLGSDLALVTTATFLVLAIVKNKKKAGEN